MNLDERIVGISRISEANPDGCFWPVIFLGGCNLRCPYCLNASSIVDGEHKYIPVSKVLEQLEDWGEDGVMISGGEPLMPNAECDIKDLISAISDGKRKVGLSTNGTYPKTLNELIKNKLISFVALDCKFYPRFDYTDKSKVIQELGGYSEQDKDLDRSLRVLFEWHDLSRDKLYDLPKANSEVRLTLYPSFINDDVVCRIAGLVPEGSMFVLQQYRKNIGFDGKLNTIEPFSSETVARLFKTALTNCRAPVKMRYP